MSAPLFASLDGSLVNLALVECIEEVDENTSVIHFVSEKEMQVDYSLEEMEQLVKDAASVNTFLKDLFPPETA